MDGRQDVGHARRLRAGPQGLAAWTEPRASPRPVTPAAALDMSPGCSQAGGGTPASRPTATAHGGRPVSPRTDARWADGPGGSGVRLLATASFTVPRPRW